jgi:hypothetical protein
MAGLDGVPARERAGCPAPAISLKEGKAVPYDRDRRDELRDDDGE